MDIEPTREQRYDLLPVFTYTDNESMGQAAAEDARRIINAAVRQTGQARIILATGNSQLSLLKALSGFRDISWRHVHVFHMDEYLGLEPDHPASFQRFLHRHLLGSVDVGEFFPIAGQPDDVERECERYAALLREQPIDVVAMGIGENGHIAFNDPPFADFDDPAWVKVVELAEASRQQQVGEGHFAILGQVPKRAITLTIPALLAPQHILCIVPEARKADAVRRSLTGPISPECPASILRTVRHARLYLDIESSSTL